MGKRKAFFPRICRNIAKAFKLVSCFTFIVTNAKQSRDFLIEIFKYLNLTLKM